MSIFRAVSDAPSRICPRELVFRFGQAALSIGLSAALNREDLRKPQAGVVTERQKALSLRGVQARIAKIQWHAHAEELAIAAYERNPKASNETIARAIWNDWNLKKVRCPGNRALGTFVSNLRRAGKLMK